MIEVLNLSALVLRDCTKRLFQAFVLILFFGSIFILLGKQLYKGVLTQKCVILPPENISDAEYAAFIINSTNWLEHKNGYFLCGNSTGSRHCPENYTCLRGADVNTYISNFNFYGSSMVTISQLMTLHFWQGLYQRMLLTAGTLHVSYFVLAFYSFLYTSGLILAIITRSYKNVLNNFEIIEKKSRLVKGTIPTSDSQKGIVRSPSCKSYELFSSQIISSDRVERQAAEIIESTTRTPEQSFESESGLKDHLAENKHKREAVRSQLAKEKTNDSNDPSSKGSEPTVRQYLREFVTHPVMEGIFLLSIAVYLTVVVNEYSSIKIIHKEMARISYYGFAGITLFEVLIKMNAFTIPEYLSSKWNAFDCVVLIIGGTELLLLDVATPILFTLRTFKLVKLMVCHSTLCYMKNIMRSCLFLFRHPVSILLIFMTICIVTGMQLYGYEYFYSKDRFPDPKPPRWYFKDFYSSFILVFCMLCGDWKQPMVNTVLFTSNASDLLMLIFVLIGNFVIINLFLGIVFYTFFYKTLPTSSLSKDRLQAAIQVILNRQSNPLEGMTNGKDSTSRRDTTESIDSEPVSDSRDNLTQSTKKSKRKNLYNQNEMEIIEDTSSEYMPDCCPSLCYFCCSFCKADENPILWQKWADVRCKLYWFVETKFFSITIALVILISIVMLVVDQSHGHRYVEIANATKILNPCILLVFLIEMWLKWMAYGLHKFFRSHLGRFEFFIVMIYMIDLLSIKLFDGQKNIFKALKAFRLLSLTSLMKSYQETVPLPMKHNNCVSGSETASYESLLHLQKFECNRFLGKHCRYRPTGSGEIFQIDCNIPEIQSSVLTDSKMRRMELNQNIEYRVKSPTIDAKDCLPLSCYQMFPACERDCSFFKYGKSARIKCLHLVRNRFFFAGVLVVILLSCVQLFVELNFSSEKMPIIKQISTYADRIFTVIFLLEMILKMFAYGIASYWRSVTGVLEGWTTLNAVSYLILHELQIKTYFALKLCRVFRLLVFHKLLGFNKQSKGILKSLNQAFASHIIAFLFVFYLWIAFGVIGVAMFKGKLYYCVNANNEVLEFAASACIANNGTLRNSQVNFDTIQNAFIALLQVATLQNWMSFVTGIIDNSDSSNEIRNEFYTASFFPLFIMFSTFLTLNLFAGITCWFYNCQKQHEKENSANWKSKWLYDSAVKKMESVKLQKTIPSPKIPFQTFIYRMVMSDNFEIAGFVFIGLHMLLIALDMYDPDPSEMFNLAMCELNIFFIVMFTIECILKLIAYRQYFFSFWNMFDLIVLALCICGALYENLFSSPMLPAMLRLIRFVKCRRYLRRYIRGMLPLTYALYTSFPAFVSVVVLQLIYMFIYASFGVHLFSGVQQSWDFSGELSFETFSKAMLLLFQLSTLAGWVDVLQCLHDDGHWPYTSIFYVVSYIIIMYYIIIKTHFIIVLDNYENSMLEYENALLKEDYEMFAEIWQKFDSNAHGIIKFSNLPDLLDVLEEPFHFGKPNRFLIATLNIPIYEGDLVFYTDVMDALTRDYMSHNAHLIEVSDSVPGLLDKKGRTLKKISCTLWRQRQHYCAGIIQRAWRQYSGTLARSPVFYSEVRLADQGKIDTVLTADIRSGSHASL